MTWIGLRMATWDSLNIASTDRPRAVEVILARLLDPLGTVRNVAPGVAPAASENRRVVEPRSSFVYHGEDERDPIQNHQRGRSGDLGGLAA